MQKKNSVYKWNLEKGLAKLTFSIEFRLFIRWLVEYFYYFSFLYLFFVRDDYSKYDLNLALFKSVLHFHSRDPTRYEMGVLIKAQILFKNKKNTYSVNCDILPKKWSIHGIKYSSNGPVHGKSFLAISLSKLQKRIILDNSSSYGHILSIFSSKKRAKFK